jgi:hypothetical protein
MSGQDLQLPPLSVLGAWQRRGSAVLDDLTEAAAWDALAANAMSPAQAGACIRRADEMVLGNSVVLLAVLDEEDRAREAGPPMSIDVSGRVAWPRARRGAWV